MKKLLCAMALLGASSSLLADDQAVTVILSDASGMTQDMAMVLANQMQAQGAQVDILLCDQAGALALKDAVGEPLKPNVVTPAHLLTAARGEGTPGVLHDVDELKRWLAQDGMQVYGGDANYRAPVLGMGVSVRMDLCCYMLLAT